MKILNFTLGNFKFLFLLVCLAFTLKVEAQAVVSVEKMNVLYRGLENPISVAIAGIDAKNVIVKVDHGLITKKDDVHYLIKPMGSNLQLTLTVSSIEGKDTAIQGVFSYRVLAVPMPNLIVANVSSASPNSNSISMASLKVNPSLRAAMDNFIFDIKCEVMSFTVSYMDGKKEVTESFKGSTIPASLLKNIEKMGNPVTLIFSKVSVKMAGYEELVTLAPLSIVIK